MDEHGANHNSGDTADGAIEIFDSPGENQYKLTIDGTLAGFIGYEAQGATTVLEHTKVFDDFTGRGLAGKLVQFALEDIRARGDNVDSQCPFVDDYINKHPEFDDMRI